MPDHPFRALVTILVCVLLGIVLGVHSKNAAAAEISYEFNDSRFHLTNYIQEGTPIRDFLKIMGTTTGRSVFFGIPLQQQWSYRVNAANAPTYYLDTEAPLYSFTDAYIAEAYLSLGS